MLDYLLYFLMGIVFGIFFNEIVALCVLGLILILYFAFMVVMIWIMAIALIAGTPFLIIIHASQLVKNWFTRKFKRKKELLNG